MRKPRRRDWGTRLARASRDVLLGVVSQGVVYLLSVVFGLIRKYGVVGLIVFTGAMTFVCLIGVIITGVAAETARQTRSRPKKSIEAIENVSTAFGTLGWLNSFVFLGAVIFGIYQAETS